MLKRGESLYDTLKLNGEVYLGQIGGRSAFAEKHNVFLGTAGSTLLQPIVPVHRLVLVIINNCLNVS